MFQSESTTTTTGGFAAADGSATPVVPESSYPFRLLSDETVLGMYPITRKRRPLGKLASFLFVTDSRVIYSAEAKSLASSSIHTKEYQVPHIHGVEVGRHSGLDALGVAAAVGVIFNFVGMIILASLVGLAGGDMGFSGGSGFEGVGFLFGFLAFASLIVGAVVVFILRRSTATLKIVGPNAPQTLTAEGDLPKLLVTILLFVIFGFFMGVIVIIWAIARELGVFKADDAQLFADPANMDRIAFDAGALILDVQARGKLAG
ncbi:hypothetical protein [Marisediminicola antarctica]|uniref:Uncharacterized protein n=1 Tax=Marisediminicola antarctica TaxID=674079 RepID=A0A7L5AJZ4_9MICO|nr:hypothetical protein [Marisediminicola antarctica]QHO70115.1 hypothetical protein BHD05_11160 [Marisediminicola antarctica]